MATLPLSLAAAISVSSILVFFTIMVAKEKQIEKGFAFILGGILCYAIVTILVVVSFSKTAPAGTPQHAGIHAVANFILAALCILLVIRASLKKEDAEKTKIDMPGGFFAYMGIGALMRAVSANTLPPFIAAVKEVSGAHLTIESSLILYAIILLTSMFPMIIPLLLFLFNKDKTVALITPVSHLLEKNKQMISNAVLIVIAIYMVMHGLTRLGMM